MVYVRLPLQYSRSKTTALFSKSRLVKQCKLGGRRIDGANNYRDQVSVGKASRLESPEKISS